MGPISVSASVTTEDVVGVDTTTSSVVYGIPSTVAPMVRVPWEPFSCSLQGGRVAGIPKRHRDLPLSGFPRSLVKLPFKRTKRSSLTHALGGRGDCFGMFEGRSFCRNNLVGSLQGLSELLFWCHALVWLGLPRAAPPPTPPQQMSNASGPQIKTVNF